MSAKPIRFGFKVFALCDSLTGYLYKYQLYVGKKYQKLCIRDLVL